MAHINRTPRISQRNLVQQAFPVVMAMLLLLLMGCGGSTAGSSASAGSGGVSGDSDTAGETSDPSPAGEGSSDDFQAGTLTAGDYDELLNPDLYHTYASDFLQDSLQDSSKASLPYVDVSEAITVIVSDSNDEPFALAKLTASVHGEPLFTRTIPSNGSITLFPGIDRLPGVFELMVSNASNDVRVAETVDLEALDEDRTIPLVLPMLSQPIEKLDLLLVIDTTGSMGDELDYLQGELTSIVGSVRDTNPNVHVRVGLVVYRDIGDSYVTKEFPLTSDIAELQANLNTQTHSGGGDYPEAMDQALLKALQFEWRDDAVKSLLLVADAPPHDNKIQATWDAAITARQEQIHIIPLAASGVGEVAEFVMRGMAVLTHSRYLFLTDDSGLGDSHKEPSIECYLVTRLDHLVIRVINALVTGQRIEPEEEHVIRTVGNYNAGICEDPEKTVEN